MKRKLVRIICVALVCVAVFGVNIQSYSIEAQPEKQEVVYVNLSGSGSAQDVYVVNIVRPDSSGLVTDYGSYMAVNNLTTTEEIKHSGDRVTIETEQDRLYYEGTLEEAQLPWSFDISYSLDGRQMSAEDIAGKSGKAEITIDVEQNTAAQSSFFDNMTLQVAVTLDTAVCSNITAAGAGTANAGRNKQITFTILPGTEKTLKIEADAQNFEMDAILINALYANMDLNVDESELIDDVTTLQDAVGKIDDGAGELEDGIGELKTAVDDELTANLVKLKNASAELEGAAGLITKNMSGVDSAAAELLAGAQGLEAGITELDEGLELLCNGLDELSAQSGGITAGSAQVYTALLQLQQGLSALPAPEDISGLTTASADIMTAINQLTAAAQALKTAADYDTYNAAVGAQTLKSSNATVISAIDAQIFVLSGSPGNDDTIAVLQQAKTALQANNDHIDATQSYFGALETNATALYDGLVSLQIQYSAFDSGLQSMAASLASLPASLEVLSDSVDSLVLQYAQLNNGIIEYTAGVVEAQGGCSAVYGGISELVVGSASLSDGLQQLKAGTGQLKSGSAELSGALNEFGDGIIELAKGVSELSSGVDELYSGAGELKDGTGELNSETAGLDTQITDQIDEMISSVSGGSGEVVSFVSVKNTNVSSVQFVMKTPAIKVKEDEESTQQDITKKSFWEKLLMLFGID